MASVLSEKEELVADGVVSLERAMQLLDCRDTAIYKLMNEGRLPYVKVGGRRKIPRSAITRYLVQNLHGDI